MMQSEAKLGLAVCSIHHPDKKYYIRENHNPKGAGLSSSLDTSPEQSFFVLYEYLMPYPDYKGFGEELAEAQLLGIPTDYVYLVKLAKKYNTPIPGTKEWDAEFNSDQNEKA